MTNEIAPPPVSLVKVPDHLAEMPVHTVPTETDLLIGNLNAELATLRGDLENRDFRIVNLVESLRSSRAESETAREQHREDMHNVSLFLHDVAERQEWCGEFEQFVAKANRVLHVEIEPRTRDYDVSFTITVNMTVNTNGSDNAREIAESAASTVRDRAYYADSGQDFSISGADVDYDSFDVEVSDR